MEKKEEKNEETLTKKKTFKDVIKDNTKGFFMGILFFSILIAILIGFSTFFENKIENDSSIVNTRYANVAKLKNVENNSIDVAVVGDSITAASISPLDIFNEHGYSSYLGVSNGQYIEESYYVIKSLFEKQSPKVVALEANVIFKDLGVKDGIQHSVVEAENYYFPSIKYHDAWKGIISDKKYDDNSYRGFLIKDTVFEGKNIDNMVQTKKSAKICKLNKIYLDKIVDLCKKNNSELVILTIPAQKPSYGSKATKYEEYNCISNYTKEKNIKMLNMNLLCKESKLDIDWVNDFSDGDEDGAEHLNVRGAKKTTSCFGNYLSKEFKLTDYRKNVKFKDWSNEYNQFDIERKKCIAQIENMIKK